ncbi:PQQ-dependent sugar dehydrogenase [Aurantimonas aggregata]|uniref:PQQ-dependent sugar dehydrogenase n=1 Tax=Aurantimonas aggregata TaxID=2047720 RepID=A0A6L9MKU0_9HYPH|nr:PQQ-dependent sugar dehydrogenase [Aurantimonas aggregata]NDV88401.1 PQQ-dependent sugar dehydrogenase [Aurantimonas aggregata]
MKTLTMLLTGTVLSAGLAVVPAHSQGSTGDASPVEQVEGQPPAEGDQGIPAGEPVETAAANAPDQEPAFPGQTRAPQPSEMPDVAVETFAEGLPQLWAMEFLPDDRMLVTAKEGDFHVISAEGEAGPALSGMIEVASAGQGGLLDVALAPDFETTNRIFFSFAEPRDGGNGTSVARATLNLDDNGGGSLEDVEVIFQQMPTYDGDKHFGSRLVFSPEGHLYVTVGERSDTPIRDEAQSLVSGLGKVFRIDPETGEAIADNPFVEHAKIQPEIWSWGHRNLQSAALDADGRLWTIEHGPRGGDELNMPEAGLNYGWPAITYGIAYSGEEVGPGRTSQEGMEQPVYYWDPVIGPSGMALYDGDEFPSWEDAFLVGGLVTTGLVVVHLDENGEQVAFEERVPLDARIRDVRVGPDGAVYAVTEDPDADTSAILRLTREQ